MSLGRGALSGSTHNLCVHLLWEVARLRSLHAIHVHVLRRHAVPHHVWLLHVATLGYEGLVCLFTQEIRQLCRVEVRGSTSASSEGIRGVRCGDGYAKKMLLGWRSGCEVGDELSKVKVQRSAECHTSALDGVRSCRWPQRCSSGAWL